MLRIKRVDVVLQFCVDPEASAKWYADFLGMEVTPYDAPLFQLENVGLLLAPGAPGTGRGGTGVYFEVPDVPAAYAELKGRGYVFNEELFDVPTGKVVTLMDPDGNIVGIEDNGATK